MSGSLTVIGGHSGSTLTGLVNIPMDQTALTLSGLGVQAALTAVSDAVTAGSASFVNNDVIGGSIAASTGSTSIGVFEITNTDSTGASTTGSSSGTFVVPATYSTLVVEAPGAYTVDGNGSSNFLAVFSGQSSVDFNALNSGTGTVVAGANDFIQVGGTFFGGQGWSVLGGASGADTINTTAENASITTQGSNNVVGLSGVNAIVSLAGSHDLVAGFGGLNTISVAGAADNILISGGADTVYAMTGSSSLDMFFFNSGGGSLDFINQSGVSASVTGGANGASGSVTVFAGTGGGYYQGGTNGNNSLVGSSGSSSTTLIGAGNTNFLSVDGSGANALFAGDGTATLMAGAGTADNLLTGGLGTDIISTDGSGAQSFFVGTTGSETLTGSSVSGALNTYYFNQASTAGGGTDVITDFKYGSDHVFINPFDSAGGVSVQGISDTTVNGAHSSEVTLTDNTIIKLVGVTFTDAEKATIAGSTSF